MLHNITLDSAKKYANIKNAEKAVRDYFGENWDGAHLRYFIHCDADGKFFPVFIGQEAIQHGIHFRFTVVG